MTKQILVDACMSCPNLRVYPVPDSDSVKYICDITNRQVPSVGIDSECPLDDYVEV